VDQLEAVKLSEWWLRKIGSEFLPEETEIDEIICNFCIWDARYILFCPQRFGTDIINFCDYFRLEHESSLNEFDESNWLAGVDWWSGHDTNLFFQNFYYLGKKLKTKNSTHKFCFSPALCPFRVFVIVSLLRALKILLRQ
jgi:hypothetical protein